MEQSGVGEQLSGWFELGGKRLKRTIHRSARFRMVLLGLLNVSGCLLMLSPLITMVAAPITAVYLHQHVQGPLDLFMIEVLAVVSLVSAIISYQLFIIHPSTPIGVDIQKAQEPRFFSMLERRLQHFKNPPVDIVKLTMSAEIRVAVTPKWPVPIAHTHTLCIGAPITFFTSEPGFRLALAGAIAASAHSRGGFPNWIAQSTLDWIHIVKALKQRPSLASKLLLRPARWLNAATSSLNHDGGLDPQRKQARWILENSGENAAAEFLATLALADSFLVNLYWPMIFKAAERCPTPVVHPFCHFELLLKKTLTMDTARRWILQAQAGRSTANQKIKELLIELNLDQLRWDRPPERNAYAKVFGNPARLKELDTLWRLSVAEDWKKRHQRFQKQKLRFEQLQEKSRQQPLRGDSAMNFVKLAARFLEPEHAVSVYKAMYANNTDDAALCFVCGEHLLAADCAEEAFDALQNAAELDSSLANRAQAIISAQGRSWSPRKSLRNGIAEIA